MLSNERAARNYAGVMSYAYKWLPVDAINAALPPDTAFDDAWRTYEYARGEFEDSHAAITILRNLDGLDPAALARCESDYVSSSEIYSATIQIVMRTHCTRPENMRRKLQLALSENADDRDVASIVADLEALEAWLGHTIGHRLA
jgi:hypothetical protein